MKNCFLIVMMTILIACDKNRSLSFRELYDYTKSEESGLYKEAVAGDFKYNATMLPYELLVAKRFGNSSSNISKNDYLKEVEKTDSLIYISFEISHTQSNKSPLRYGNSGKEQFYNKLYYIQAEIIKDFEIIVDGTSVPCLMANYEEDHNLLPVTRVLLAFSPTPVTSELILSYNDNLFGQGKIQFKYKASDINNTPILKTI